MSKYHLLRSTFEYKPPTAVKGEGSYIYMDDGNRVVDASGGAAVLSIGHGVKEIADAMYTQISTICYVTHSIFTSDPAEDLANEIIGEKYQKMGYSKVMFVNSGSEANENAYKLARQYFYDKGERQRVNLIGRDIAYHGNTILDLALSGTTHRKAPYEDVLPYDKIFKVSTPHPRHLKLEGESDESYVARLLEELDAKFEELGPDTVMAVFFEPILGTSGGCALPPKGYLQGVRSICNKYGALLIFDEVICGSGRCGSYYFAWEHFVENGDFEAVQPDIITCGKALSGGYAPLSAVVSHRKLIDNIEATSKKFVSGQTFQSHIISCAAGLAVQKYIKRNNLLDNVTVQGKYLKEQLDKAIGDYTCVLDIRGIGLFWTVELVKNKATQENYPMDYDFATLAHKLILKHGVSVYPGRGSIDGVNGYSFLVSPAFNVDKKLVDEIVLGIELGLKDAMATASKDCH